jgi:hypothetical protein
LKSWSFTRFSQFCSHVKATSKTNDKKALFRSYVLEDESLTTEDRIQIMKLLTGKFHMGYRLEDKALNLTGNTLKAGLYPLSHANRVIYAQEGDNSLIPDLEDVFNLVQEIKLCEGHLSEERREEILKNFITRFDVVGDERDLLFKSLADSSKIGISHKSLSNWITEIKSELSPEDHLAYERDFFGFYLEQKGKIID